MKADSLDFDRAERLFRNGAVGWSADVSADYLESSPQEATFHITELSLFTPAPPGLEVLGAL